MSKNYGVGYLGSKNKIAEKIIADLPAGENLYDIFAGGCAITHCASESGKWEHIHTNDINGGILQVFKKSLNGEIKPNSVIYCDPPYITDIEIYYDKYFNQPRFFKSAQNKANDGHQVFVSAYNIKQPNFHKVNEYTISSCFNSNKKEVLYKVEPENN